METLWKCAAVGLTASLLGLTIRRESAEQTLLLGLSAAAMILITALRSLGAVSELLRSAGENGGLSAAMTVPVLKSLVLALIGRLAGGFCRDAGQSAVAAAVETAAVCAILCVSVPLLESLIAVIVSYT